jgi:hypothetical protein
MPEHTITLNDEDRALIERVQMRRGFPTLEAAAEWLVKTRLRRAGRTTGGHGGTLFLVHARSSSEGAP